MNRGDAGTGAAGLALRKQLSACQALLLRLRTLFHDAIAADVRSLFVLLPALCVLTSPSGLAPFLLIRNVCRCQHHLPPLPQIPAPRTPWRPTPVAASMDVLSAAADFLAPIEEEVDRHSRFLRTIQADRVRQAEFEHVLLFAQALRRGPKLDSLLHRAVSASSPSSPARSPGGSLGGGVGLRRSRRRGHGRGEVDEEEEEEGPGPGEASGLLDAPGASESSAEEYGGMGADGDGGDGMMVPLVSFRRSYESVGSFPRRGACEGVLCDGSLLCAWSARQWSVRSPSQACLGLFYSPPLLLAAPAVAAPPDVYTVYGTVPEASRALLERMVQRLSRGNAYFTCVASHPSSPLLCRPQMSFTYPA